MIASGDETTGDPDARVLVLPAEELDLATCAPQASVQHVIFLVRTVDRTARGASNKRRDGGRAGLPGSLGADRAHHDGAAERC